jgi:tRNA U38,U39,U40 pseudouridine synthase TruA
LNLIKNAFSKISKTPIQIKGASKIDTGVHAILNIGHVDMPPRINRETKEYV